MKSATAVGTDDNRYRHWPMLKRTLARSTSVKESASTSSRAASSRVSACSIWPRPERAAASASRARSLRSGSRSRPVSSTRPSVAIASSNSSAAMAASAREIRPPSRSCSADEMPVSRNRSGTSSRSASHSRAASLGRTRPRSIWLTYSFEKRPSPSLVCVRPRAMRSCRRRSPSAEGVGPSASRVRGSGGMRRNVKLSREKVKRAPEK